MKGIGGPAKTPGGIGKGGTQKRVKKPLFPGQGYKKPLERDLLFGGGKKVSLDFTQGLGGEPLNLRKRNPNIDWPLAGTAQRNFLFPGLRCQKPFTQGRIYSETIGFSGKGPVGNSLGPPLIPPKGAGNGGRAPGKRPGGLF